MAVSVKEGSNIFKRRSFLGKISGLAALPFGLSAFPFGAFGRHAAGLDDIPDLEKVKELLTRKASNIWLFTGDSITHGAKHTHGYRSYPEIFQERVRWELSRIRDLVINTGMSSQTTAEILGDFDWRVAQFKPSFVSLMIGTNDCARKGLTTSVYAENLNQLIVKIRETGAVPLLHTPNTIILETSPERATLPEYIPVIRRIAQEQKVLLVDNYAHWQRALENDPQKKVFQEWLNDRLHPNQTGHQEIARLMFRTMDIFDLKAPTCNGEYYEGEH